MPEIAKQAILDFYTYPPIGGDDWRYVFETAEVRAMEIGMLSRSLLLDMVNADGFAQASELLSGTEYAIGATGDFGRVENMLGERRTAIRELFAQLMHDPPIVELLKSRDDFANLRLVLRRVLTGKTLAADYSPDGNASPDVFSNVFEEERYDLLPDYMRQAADAAVLAYYEKKDVRQIDYAIDAAEAAYNLAKARRLGSAFLTGLFKIQIDLTNIRTMFRLKFTESENRKVFLDGGFIELERFIHGPDLGYEALGPLFFVTPYHRIVESGAAYLTSNKSFLKLEQQCDEHLGGFLKLTVQITAGPQPIIAYLLKKENEIRTVRLILTAKRNSLDTKLILDRIA
ncbi:MAG: V-type ATPase subunit [Sedimentisphaerales bacterium]|nr:V-type ATPase subunit [Sedimentisphaerales bacterium]